LAELRELSVVTIVIRVFLALIIGGIIGMEREIKKQAAGFRTYMLVCLGATLVMMTNQYICNVFATGDPSRLGAQVISGIGFLGAGTIIVTRRSQVRGLTTAAGLWSAACIGVAIGIGFYEGAIVVGIAIILVMTLLQKIDYLLTAKSGVMHLYMNFTSVKALNHFVEHCRQEDMRMIDLQISKNKDIDRDGIVVIMTLKIGYKVLHVDLIQSFSEMEGLKYIEEI